MNRLGIMSGRLSPPIKGKIQAFPFDTWEDEFMLAKKFNLDCIEWIFELSNIELNPICKSTGIQDILELSYKYDVKVSSLVADNFMEEVLYNEIDSGKNNPLDRLMFLIRQASFANIPIIEVPLMGKTSVKDREKRAILIKKIKVALDYAAKKNIIISFELDLDPLTFLSFMQELDHPNAGINYDMGNSAILGYDPKVELNTFGKYIVNVHIKDGIKGGSTVPLGTGDTDFDTVFNSLKSLGYKGDYILQAARKDLPNYPKPEPIDQTIRDYVSFVKKWL